MPPKPLSHLPTSLNKSFLHHRWPRLHIKPSSTRPRSIPPAPYQSPPKPTSSPSSKPRPSYKQLERRWLGIMVGLPFTIVSGYILYKREVLGEDPRVKGPGAGEQEEEEGGIRHPKTGRKATFF